MICLSMLQMRDPVSFTFKLPEEDTVISTGRMNIYEGNTNELVASVNAEYDLNSKLNAQSKRLVKDYIYRAYLLSYSK